jgi:hypothetical protein
MRALRALLLVVCLCLLTTAAEAKTISVGYQYGMERYYPGAWSALDQGRREAQQEWAKWANITWAGASRPTIYIRPTGSSTVWGYYRAPNSIYVTYSRKVWKLDSQWKDPKVWKSLFLHEYGHYFVKPTGHCNNPVGTGKCLMTIQSGRQSQLCSSCLKKLQTRYGKPTAKGQEEATKPETLPVLEPAQQLLRRHRTLQLR